jgi:molybdopterin-biosynthesis enzyme MoeA-like protein
MRNGLQILGISARRRCDSMKQVSVIATGTELMNGSTVDTNSSFISGFFTPRTFMCAVTFPWETRRDDILNACNACLGDSDCVIMSGWPGPHYERSYGGYHL